MTGQYRSVTPGVGDAAPLPEDLIESAKALRVVLLDYRRDIETPDSFAIKFSLLTKTPLPKVKQMVRSLPVVIWRGSGRGKASRILKIIEEAGGKGGIEIDLPAEEEKAPQAADTGAGPTTGSADRTARETASCRYCGFPLKPGDERCEFCRTSVKEQAAHHAVPAARAVALAGIPKGRLVFYILLIVAGIAMLVFRR